jgi:hypothetical protein
MLQYWLTLSDFDPEGSLGDVFLFPPRANYPKASNGNEFNFRSSVTVGVFDKAFVKACNDVDVNTVDIASQSIRKTSWGFHYAAGADTASQQIDGRLKTTKLIETYRGDQIPEINRLRSTGKDFSFVGKYRGLDIADPVISRMTKTHGTLHQFNRQFVHTYVILSNCSRFGDPRSITIHEMVLN